jgi:hypothetical protein
LYQFIKQQHKNTTNKTLASWKIPCMVISSVTALRKKWGYAHKRHETGTKYAKMCVGIYVMITIISSWPNDAVHGKGGEWRLDEQKIDLQLLHHPLHVFTHTSLCNWDSLHLILKFQAIYQRSSMVCSASHWLFFWNATWSTDADSLILFTICRLIHFYSFSSHSLLGWKLPFSSPPDSVQ